jgi:hypothetical protein
VLDELHIRLSVAMIKGSQLIEYITFLIIQFHTANLFHDFKMKKVVHFSNFFKITPFHPIPWKEKVKT